MIAGCKTIEEAGTKLRAREVSAVELAQESLARIHAAQPRFNAFITITADLALEQARRADEDLAHDIDRGPLQGIPYALKDVFATRGIPTTCGSKIFRNRMTDHDSDAYEKLTAAGAVLMGKTGLHEFAYGITSNNPHFGAIRNPHDPERIPGGSSGGSGVAVAAGLVFFAMGTDTGGSIRVPAAYCGCVGLKPTYGRVSRDGVFPLGFSLDHIGPLAGTVHDAALVMKVIAGFQAVAGDITGRRIGVPRSFFLERLAPEVDRAFHQALAHVEGLGAHLIPIDVPDPAAISTIGRLILLSEASALLKPYLDRREDFGPDVLSLLEQGLLVSAADYIDAQRLRRIYQQRWMEIQDHVDFVFTPTTAIQAPPIGQDKVRIDGSEEDVRLASTRFVRPFNVLGLPALSIPSITNGLPAGLQIVGKSGSDEDLLAFAGSAFSPHSG
ncbi:MAG TPA: amidase [Bryobacteraceae bacterium]|nr:amidase [Bryobacteraceae bacterium]